MNTFLKKISTKVLVILLLIILSVFVSAKIANAQSNSSLWKLLSGNLMPIRSTWQLRIPSLNSSGTKCLQVNSVGLISATASGCVLANDVIPYIGATADVDLGDFQITAKKLISNTGTVDKKVQAGGRLHQWPNLITNTVSASEEEFYSYSVPPGTFANEFDSMSGEFALYSYTNTGNDKRIRVYIKNDVVFDSGMKTIDADTGISLKFEIMKYEGGVKYIFTYLYTASGRGYSFIQTGFMGGAELDGSSFKLTSELSGGSLSNDDIQGIMGTLYYHPASL